MSRLNIIAGGTGIDLHDTHEPRSLIFLRDPHADRVFAVNNQAIHSGETRTDLRDNHVKTPPPFKADLDGDEEHTLQPRTWLDPVVSPDAPGCGIVKQNGRRGIPQVVSYLASPTWFDPTMMQSNVHYRDVNCKSYFPFMMKEAMEHVPSPGQGSMSDAQSQDDVRAWVNPVVTPDTPGCGIIKDTPFFPGVSCDTVDCRQEIGNHTPSLAPSLKSEAFPGDFYVDKTFKLWKPSMKRIDRTRVTNRMMISNPLNYETRQPPMSDPTRISPESLCEEDDYHDTVD